MSRTIEKIISGGQTGADRAALDFAIEHGLPHGGWCPKGRRAEDGTIPDHYQLKETPSEDYQQRNRMERAGLRWNGHLHAQCALTGGRERQRSLRVAITALPAFVRRGQ